MTFNIGTFVEEFYNSHRQNRETEYVVTHWGSALKAFNDENSYMDRLIEVSWNCMSKNDEAELKDIKEKYIKQFGKADEN